MQFLKLYPTISYSLNNSSSITSRSFLYLFSTVSSLNQALKEHTSILNYLSTNFKFSKNQSIFISKRVSQATCPQKPLFVLDFLKQIGFSKAQIQSMICQSPQILFSDVDKTLKPKIEYFQLQSFEGSKLTKLLSKNSNLLNYSLNKTLVPSVETIRKISDSEKHFINELHRSGAWILPKYRKVLRNVAFFESCGIVGSQLSLLFKQKTWILTASESLLRNVVSQAVNMGFRINSRMLVYAVQSISSVSMETFKRKLELLQSYGFSKDESMQMFRRAPLLIRTSEKKVKFGIEFFLDTIKLPKSALVHNPTILMFSMENRVIPRCRVLQVLKSKNVLKNNPCFVEVLRLPEEIFLKGYISQFKDDAEALLVAYRGHCLEDAST